MKRKNIIIIGAAGRDFHNFNICYRDNEAFKVVAFTAAQIPDIAGRKYPEGLAGRLYPDGIPIYAEEDLPSLIKDLKVDCCVFSYSDIEYRKVMGISAVVNAAGADFLILGKSAAQIKSTRPLIAVGAVRTGCGKSQTSRRIVELLMRRGLKVVAVRHPMPYGDLNLQRVQRFARIEDLSSNKCTIEEMEEYEPHITRGNVIYAGVDYEAILREAEKDAAGCDVILWDGGNNDFPFYVPDLMVTVTDPHRPGHELSYYPGEVTLRIADVAIINKTDSADPVSVRTVRNNILKVNPDAIVVEAESPITVENEDIIRGKRVVVIEDGPTLTHGEMKIGAGILAARKFGASQIIDPRPYVKGRIRETFMIYPEIGTLIPAMGYGAQQLLDLEESINSADCDSVIIGTPIDLARIIRIRKPHTRVHYELKETGKPDLEDIVDNFIREHRLDHAAS
jgi:predicted GTPase